MTPLASPSWYHHQAVLMALAVNERLQERDGTFDPIWASVLFTNLLGLDVRGGKGQRLTIDPYAFPRSVRSRLAWVARSTDIEAWARARFKWGRTSAASRTAKLVATLLHRRDVPPRTLWRIARGELSGTALPREDEIEEPLGDLSAALRQVRPRAAKLRSIAHFVEAVPLLRTSWPALEPALVQPLLDWVPAVVGHAGPMTRPGVMIPLMVDVANRGNSEPVTVTGTLQDTGAIERSVQRALDSSCALWRNRHSNAPSARLREVLDAKVRVDLQLVEGIAQACIRAPNCFLDLDARLDLDGRSLELPIALAIYDRLVGSRAHGDIRASGTLGEYTRDEQDPLSGNTYLGYVRGETAKALAAEAQLADRFVLAKGSERPSADLPTVFATTLGAAVDQAFGGDGDGHRLVRAADLAAEFKEIGFTTDQIRVFKDDLKSGSIVHETDKPLRLVAQALFHVNKQLGPQKYPSRGRYTFVRLSPTERGDAAWASIWSALDGDATDFAEFVNAASLRRRAELVARQMSRNANSMADPRWSPHVLVLAGLPWAKSASGRNGGAFGRFDIRQIMTEVETVLSGARSPCDRRLQMRIGATRVILVEADGMDGFNGPPPALDPDLDRAIERLSAFRYGFSFNMARRQLGTADTPMPANECEDILVRLQNVLCEDNLALLVVGCTNAGRRSAAPTAFDYMLRRRRLPTALTEQLAVHEQAAHAIAPILHPSRSDAHVDLASGLGAGWLDEAYSQLSNARQIAIKLGLSSEKTRLFGLRLRLLRLSGWFILERLSAMMGRSGNDVLYEDFADRIRPTDHPALHAHAAAFATTLASNADDLGERRRLYQAALQHLNDGATACRRLVNPDERGGAIFLIASERCRLAHVGRREPDDVLAPAYRDLWTYAPLALDHLANMRELYWVEWFARVGALIEDHSLANRVYLAGLWNEALPGDPQVGDETLIGWAGTLGPFSSVDPDLLRRVRAHLQNGFFGRRYAATLEAMEKGERPTPRTQAGMRRLTRIAALSRTLKSPAVRAREIAGST